MSHDGDSVPFAPGCTRVEQGVKNGFSGKHLRRSLSRGPQYRVIGATTTPRYTVDGDEIRAEYEVLTKLRVPGRRVAAAVALLAMGYQTEFQYRIRLPRIRARLVHL